MCKIRCIVKDEYGLTYDKIYDAAPYSLNNDGSVAYWLLSDDNGLLNFVSSLYFVQVDKFRDEQIDKILE